MNFVQILANCPSDIVDILSIIKLIIKGICWVVPIILIILLTVDVAKIVTAGNLDDKMKKEVGNKIISRLIYAIVIFLIPTIVSLLFRIIGSTSVIKDNENKNANAIGCSWSDAWDEA